MEIRDPTPPPAPIRRFRPYLLALAVVGALHLAGPLPAYLWHLHLANHPLLLEGRFAGLMILCHLQLPYLVFYFCTGAFLRGFRSGIPACRLSGLVALVAVLDVLMWRTLPKIVHGWALGVLDFAEVALPAALVMLGCGAASLWIRCRPRRGAGPR